MTIRISRPDDAPDLAAMWLEMQAEQAAIDPRYKLSEDAGRRWQNDLREWIDAPDVRRVIVAESDGGFVGFATALLNWPPPIYEQEEEVFVEDVYVRRSHRGQGIGAALFGDLKNWATENGVTLIRLRALSRNRDALDFWMGTGGEEFVTELLIPLTAAQ